MATKSDAPQLVQLTPPGRGAVATLLVCGPQATETVALWFHPVSKQPLASATIDRILFGRWGSGENAAGEEIVVCRRAADRIEIHCHGGDAAVARIREDLESQGGESISWQAWSEATANDPIAAAAQQALTQCHTERTAAILLDQYDGSLRRVVEAIINDLQGDNLSQAQAQLERLLEFAPLGRHLTKPFLVVLAGRPNVGKSSLINALLGYQRSIVFEQPGTTRDLLFATTAIDGWPVELADTAGLRDSDDPIEAEGVRRAGDLVAKSDLLLLVVDASAPPTEEDRALLARYDAPLVVQNKSDLGHDDAWDRINGSAVEGVAISALTGDSIPALLDAISRQLMPNAPPKGTAIPFTEVQISTLQIAHDALLKSDVGAAIETLCGLVENARFDDYPRSARVT